MFLMFIRLAFRNLWRHTRRTMLTAASIGCGCAVILWMQAIIQGRNENMINVITSTYIGYVQIYQPNYLVNRQAKDFIPDAKFESEILPRLHDTAWTTRLHLPTLVSSGEDSAPVILEGIDTARETNITKVDKNLVRGSFLTTQTACEKKEIYLGEALAEILHVNLGDKLVLLTQAVDGTLGNDLFRVVGIFRSGSRDFDKGYLFTSMPCAKELGAIRGVHEVVLKPNDLARVDEMQARLTAELPAWKVSTWREAIPSVATMIHYNDATLKMTVFILFSVITMGVINTLLMNLFERTKEFGVVLSLGLTPGQLRWLIFLESFFLGLLGIALGTLMGYIVVRYHQWVGYDMSPFFGKSTGTDGFTFDLIIRPIFIWRPYLKIVGLELLFLVAAGLYPAWKVARLNPIEVLRS